MSTEREANDILGSVLDGVSHCDVVWVFELDLV